MIPKKVKAITMGLSDKFRASASIHSKPPNSKKDRVSTKEKAEVSNPKL